MKKMHVSLVVFWLLTVVFGLQFYDQSCSAETLKVIQDQFEFRDEPRVADETILGTLRVGTPVEWTGEASGSWLRVKAPNGQIGWVHNSGLSKPTTRVQPAPTPRPQTSRSISAPAPSNQTQLQATIRKLEQANKQYQGTLTEKDRRIAELNKDIEALEAKLTDVAQMIDDQGQLRKIDQIKTDELQNELLALQDAIKKKDEALLTEKVERTKLVNQLNDLQLQSEERSSRERFWLYALSLPLNLLALLVIGFWGIRRLRRQKSEDVPLEWQEREESETPIIAHKQDVQKESENALSSQQATEEKQVVETGLEELDIVMTSSAETESAFEPGKAAIPQELPADEEVVIDLSDVLSAEQTGSLTSEEEKEEIEIVVAELESEESEEILPEEFTEIIGTQQPPEIEEILSEEPDALIEEDLQTDQNDEILEIEESEHAVEIFPEEIAEESDIGEEVDQVMIIETDEALTPIDESLDDHVEALLEDLPPMSQDASLEELLEEGELEEFEEEVFPETGTSGQAFESAVSAEIEIEGEKFEMLVERNTQIIELAEEEPFEEEASSEMAVSDKKKATRTLQEQTSPEKPDIPEKVTTFDDIILTSAASDEETFESSDIDVTPIFEPETSQTEQSEPEVFPVEQQDEEEKLFKQIPSFLEPTPFLIEPEHEPEEGTSEQDSAAAASAERSKEPRYDIELIHVGKNPEHIIHILSKIEGLTKAPQELIEHTPCIIAYGAKETDAKNFQVVMQKFGSEVRLIKR